MTVNCKKIFKPMYWVWKLSNIFSRENMFKYLDIELDKLSLNNGELNILNVGAGGELSARINKLHNANVTNIDIDLNKQPCVVADITNLPIVSDSRFDVVFILEVLEHVNQPDKAVREIFRILKPGGSVVASTPFMLEIHEAPYDYYRFTRYGLEYLFREFEAVTIRARSRYVISSLVPILRLWKSEHLMDKFIGVGLLFMSILLYPVIKFIDLVVSSDAITTGYLLTAKTPL